MKTKRETKDEAFARIRSGDIRPEDMTDERPRVRRAALCHMATTGDEKARIRALDTAVKSSERTFVSVLRATARRGEWTQGCIVGDVVHAAIELRVEGIPPGEERDRAAAALFPADLISP